MIANVIMIVNIVIRKRQRMKEKIARKFNKGLHVEVDKGKLIAEQDSDLL